MNNRIASIDVLRGITIFLMILSGSIGWGSGLPAWMFHCQVPPPDFVFNPDIKGITWVDMIFPFFLFSMGASMPFSLGGKLKRGVSVGKISLDIVKRWLTLAAFGLVLGNAGLIISTTDIPKVLLRLGIWLGMFLALWRVPDGKIKPWAVNLAGLVTVIAGLVTEHLVFGAKLSVYSNNIIIMILSCIALAGSFIWLLTRDKMWLRALILLLACVFKEITWHSHALDFLQFPKEISWLINWRYIQYLVVCIAGMTVGDVLRTARERQEILCRKPENIFSIAGALLGLIIIPLMLWAFYTRNIWAAANISVGFAVIYVLISRTSPTPTVVISKLGYLLLVLGVMFDPIDGGITKDHCNLSYMLSTSGMACLLLGFLLWLEAILAGKGQKFMPHFALLGQNPMIAYTSPGFIINPLYYLCGLGAIVDAASTGNPFMGIVRGLIVTLMMMAFTCIFSKKKIYWRT